MNKFNTSTSGHVHINSDCDLWYFIRIICEYINVHLHRIIN